MSGDSGVPKRSVSSRPKQAADSLDAEHLEMYKATLEEGRRAVGDQLDELNGIRQRSVQFVAFVSAATAFLAGAVLSSSLTREGLFYPIAIIATAFSLITIFALLGTLSGWVFRREGPKRFRIRTARFNFTNEPGLIVKSWIDPDLGRLGQTKFFRSLALTYDRKLAQNEPMLRVIRRWYRVVISAGSLQVAMWAAMVWIFR